MASATLFKTPNTTKIPQTVEISCKTSCKTLWKFRVNPREFLSLLDPARAKLHFPTDFSLLSHHLSHHPAPLFLTYLFHYSTDPTIITTNNFIERIF